MQLLVFFFEVLQLPSEPRPLHNSQVEGEVEGEGEGEGEGESEASRANPPDISAR